MLTKVSDVFAEYGKTVGGLSDGPIAKELKEYSNKKTVGFVTLFDYAIVF